MCHNEEVKKASRKNRSTVDAFSEGRGRRRTASIRDLHLRTGALVQEAADGEVIVIEKRGVPLAELRSVGKEVTAAQVFAERERSGYYARMRKMNSRIDQFISEGRDR